MSLLGKTKIKFGAQETVNPSSVKVQTAFPAPQALKHQAGFVSLIFSSGSGKRRLRAAPRELVTTCMQVTMSSEERILQLSDVGRERIATPAILDEHKIVLSPEVRAMFCKLRVAALTVALSGANGAAIAGLTFMGGYLSAIGTGVGSLLIARFGRNTLVSAEELRALSTGLELGRPEMVYLDTVCALLEAGDNISEQTGEDILSTLGTLLEQARYVHDRRERLRKATGAESAADLMEERERLAGRIAKVEDPQARQDLTQSLGMCDERLRNARELSPLLERLDAQWEVIDQTLLSVQASVSRLQVAPTALSAPDVEEVKRVVDQVTAQTQAVEDAVQQVMSLRS